MVANDYNACLLRKNVAVKRGFRLYICNIFIHKAARASRCLPLALGIEKRKETIITMYKHTDTEYGGRGLRNTRLARQFLT